jgi:hypothetical protein
MTVNLSEELKRAVEIAGTPLKMVDPSTGETYVLSREGDEDSLADTYRAQVESALRAGWDDPIMDEYNNYDRYRQK